MAINTYEKSIVWTLPIKKIGKTSLGLRFNAIILRETGIKKGQEIRITIVEVTNKGKPVRQCKTHLDGKVGGNSRYPYFVIPLPHISALQLEYNDSVNFIITKEFK